MNKNQIFLLAIIQFILLFAGCFQTNSSDITKPIITLKGYTSTAAIIGNPYIDSGAVAIDAEDGDITSKISIIISNGNSIVSNIDTTTKGTFEIRYTVADRAGNLSNTAVRKVIVREPLKSNYKTVFIRGTGNNWATTLMELIDDYHWIANNIPTGSTTTSRFKFDIKADWGTNFGDTNKDGVCEQSGGDILFSKNGVYTIEFFDNTKKYILTFVK